MRCKVPNPLGLACILASAVLVSSHTCASAGEEIILPASASFFDWYWKTEAEDGLVPRNVDVSPDRLENSMLRFAIDVDGDGTEEVFHTFSGLGDIRGSEWFAARLNPNGGWDTIEEPVFLDPSAIYRTPSASCRVVFVTSFDHQSWVFSELALGAGGELEVVPTSIDLEELQEIDRDLDCDRIVQGIYGADATLMEGVQRVAVADFAMNPLAAWIPFEKGIPVPSQGVPLAEDAGESIEWNRAHWSKLCKEAGIRLRDGDSGSRKLRERSGSAGVARITMPSGADPASDSLGRSWLGLSLAISLICVAAFFWHRQKRW